MPSESDLLAEEPTIKPIERLVFSGGGAKGAIYSSAIRALSDTGVYQNVKEIAGSSAGAIVASMVACGMSADMLRDIVLNLNFTDLGGSRFGNIFKKNPKLVFFLTKDGEPLLNNIRSSIILSIKTFFNEAISSPFPLDVLAIYNKLQQENPLPSFTFRDLQTLTQHYPDRFKRLTIPAVRPQDGALVIFNETLTPDVDIALATRASASIPLYFKPVEISINGQVDTYIDGGFYDNLPTEYFDIGKDNEFLPNQKKDQTLLFAFDSEGDGDPKSLFRCLHGSQTHFTYKAEFIEKLLSHDYFKKFTGIQGATTFIEEKMRMFAKIRQDYLLRTVALHVGPISTLDFELANKNIRTIDAIGYLDTINFICNHQLDQIETFSLEVFYMEVMTNFECIYRATVLGAGQNITDDILYLNLCKLKEQLADKPKSVIAREYCHMIQDAVHKNITSLAAFAFTRAIEYYANQIAAETVLKEITEKCIILPDRLKNNSVQITTISNECDLFIATSLIIILNELKNNPKFDDEYRQHLESIQTTETDDFIKTTMTLRYNLTKNQNSVNIIDSSIQMIADVRELLIKLKRNFADGVLSKDELKTTYSQATKVVATCLSTIFQCIRSYPSHPESSKDPNKKDDASRDPSLQETNNSQPNQK